jgi:hypothetical protein
MSGGWPSRPKNVGWCGPERSDYTARVFCPKGLALTAWGPQAPLSNRAQPQAAGRQSAGGITQICRWETVGMSCAGAQNQALLRRNFS